MDPDLLTSPETLTYAPGGTLPEGTYAAQACPFDPASVLATGDYVMVVSTSDIASRVGEGKGKQDLFKERAPEVLDGGMVGAGVERSVTIGMVAGPARRHRHRP